MSDLIKREDAIDTIEEVDWYHQNKNKDMVSGANSSEHQAWYKADDIYKTIESLPSAFHWTPCSEAQPKESGEYLVTLQFKWAKEIDIGEWLDGRWIGLYADDIVAWMDLPEVWEEGSDES